MTIHPLSNREIELLREHCQNYVESFATAKVTMSERAIAPQPRTLEYEQQLRPGGPTTRLNTPESKLLQRLSAGSARQIFVTGDAATGDGGSGKSEFTRQLARVAAAQALVDLPEVSAASASAKLNPRTVIPVRYELQDLTLGADLTGVIKDELAVSDDDHPELLQTLLTEGQLLIILDGVDELRSGVAKEFSNKLRKFRRDVKKCPVIFAGREASMRPAWNNSHPKIQTYRLEPFTAHQVELFIRNYFAGPEKSRKFVNSFVVAARGVPLLRQPFMLAMACSGVRGEKIDLPADPFAFMERGLSNLLYRRHYDYYRTLPPSVVLEKLKRLAAFAVDQDFRFSADQLQELSASAGDQDFAFTADVLNKLAPHTGILSVQGIGEAIPEYSFTNRVIAEYLAGAYIAIHGPVRFADDWYDQAISDKTAVPGVATALSRSLAFYGRHIWSDAKRNTLRWIAAAWWRGGEDSAATALRAGEWLIKHLSDANGNALDDVRLTLLERLVELLSGCPDELPPPLARGLHHVVKPNWPFVRPFASGVLYLGHHVLASLKSKAVLAPYIKELAAKLGEFWPSSFEPGESGPKPWQLADLTETLAAVATVEDEPIMRQAEAACAGRLKFPDFPDFWNVGRLVGAVNAVAAGEPKRLRNATDTLTEKLGQVGHEGGALAAIAKGLADVAAGQPQCLSQAVEALMQKLREPGLDGADVAGIAEALATLAPDQPERLRMAADAVMKHLREPKLDAWRAAGLAKALAAVAAGEPERLEDVADMLLREMGDLGAYGVAGMAKALAFVAEGKADRLTQAAMVCKQKMFGPLAPDPWAFGCLADAMGAVAAGDENLLIKVAEACLERLAEPGYDGVVVSRLAQAVVAVAAVQDGRLSRGASDAFTKKFKELGIQRWVVDNLVEALVVVASGDQAVMAKAAEAILSVDDDASPRHHRAGVLRVWTNQVVVCGPMGKLIEWRRQMKWDRPSRGRDSADLVRVCQLQREEERHPEQLENSQAADDCPAFLLAPREDLTPGLDLRLLPEADRTTKEVGDPALNHTTRKARQAAALGQSDAPVEALPKRSKNRKVPHTRMETREILDLVRQIAKNSKYDPSTLATILAWTAKGGGNSTDAMTAIVEIANAVSPEEVEIVIHKDPDTGRRFVESTELVLRLSRDDARKALASRAAEWAKRSAANPSNISEEDLNNKISICPGCGCIDRLVRPKRRGDSLVKSPCQYCKTGFTEKAITVSPEYHQICETANCAANTAHVKFALPAPENGWANLRRQKGLCPICNALLVRGKPANRSNA